MATVAFSIICAYLLWEFVVPAIKVAHEKEVEQRERNLFLTKLRMVRKYYPELAEYTYTEIADQYDVEALWNNMGTHPRRTIQFLESIRAH